MKKKKLSKGAHSIILFFIAIFAYGLGCLTPHSTTLDSVITFFVGLFVGFVITVNKSKKKNKK